MRTGSDYKLMEANPEQPEQFLLPKFSFADRNRNRIDLALELVPHKDISLTFSGAFAVDEYDRSLFNLLEGKTWATGAEIRWAPGNRLALRAGYTHEEFRTRQADGTYAGAVVTARDSLDSLGGQLDFDIIPERLRLVSRGSFSLANSECPSVPAATGELARMESFLQYKYTGQLSLKFGYLFEDFGAGRNGIYFREPFGKETYVKAMSLTRCWGY